jgi:hypothetical protein
MCPDSNLGQDLWVDPREFPNPPLRLPIRSPSPDVSGILELVRLCREGRIYEVERWIREGRPLQAIDYRSGARSHRLDSPLRVAIETKQYDLARLLLCNGFLPDSEPESLLNLVARSRSKDFLELLLAWDADPKRVLGLADRRSETRWSTATSSCTATGSAIGPLLILIHGIAGTSATRLCTRPRVGPASPPSRAGTGA